MTRLDHRVRWEGFCSRLGTSFVRSMQHLPIDILPKPVMSAGILFLFSSSFSATELAAGRGRVWRQDEEA
eukprot:scaffold1499_cov255-Pinguiococcus_pyrenoidosus.AAC.40